MDNAVAFTMTNLLSHLTFLYGSERTPQLFDRVQKIMAGHRPRIHKRDGSLTERDSILITYGDQVQSRDETPLQTLNTFCNHFLTDVVNGIHILPFYPSTSDDGFSVVDYRRVHPAFGKLGDVSGVQGHFRFMFERGTHHVSSHKEGFKECFSKDLQYVGFFFFFGGAPG